MPSGGDYTYYHKLYGKYEGNAHLAGGAETATALITAKSAKHTVYLQKVVYSIKTHADGKILTIEDSAGTPVLFAQFLDDAENDTTSGHVSDVWIADFGPEGVPLTEGKNLNYVANTGGSGHTGLLHAVGYQKINGAVTQAQAATGG